MKENICGWIFAALLLACLPLSQAQADGAYFHGNTSAAASTDQRVIMFKNGAPSGSLLGAQPRPKLEELISRTL